MVHRMHPLVEPRRVDQPMDAEEMERVDDRHDQCQCSQVVRILRDAQPWSKAVGERPEDEHLDGGPDCHARQNAAQDIVDILALEPERLAFCSDENLPLYLNRRSCRLST